MKRLIIEIPSPLKERFDKLFVLRGLRRAVLQVLIEDLVDLVEKRGLSVLTAILDRRCKLYGGEE